MADLKISQFTDGGAIQSTDEIATNRGGVNTKVFVGTAAALDTGTADGDIPIITSGGLPVGTGITILTDTTGVTGADPVYNIIALTLAEYGAIVSPDAETVYLITDSMTYANAANIPYDNSTSGLTATNVQDALDELAGLV